MTARNDYNVRFWRRPSGLDQDWFDSPIIERPTTPPDANVHVAADTTDQAIAAATQTLDFEPGYAVADRIR